MTLGDYHYGVEVGNRTDNLIVVLICASLMVSDIEHLSICQLVICYVFFREMSIQVFCPSFNWIVCSFLVPSLYILDINPLLDVSLANIFFHSLNCSFVLLVVSSTVQKLLGLT